MKKNGFTLIEMVMGMGALALISLAVMSIFKNVNVLTKNSNEGQSLTSFFNEIRMKTDSQQCLANLGTIILQPTLEDIVLGSASPELQRFNEHSTNLKLTSLKLIQRNSSEDIYSGIITVDTSLQTKNFQRRAVQVSVIYLKTDKNFKGIECSNKPI